MQRLWVPGKLPSMNELLGARRAGKHDGYNRIKKEWEQTVAWNALAQGFRPVGPSHFAYLYYRDSARGDPSNFMFGAIKIIEDALVGAKMLANDGQKHVLSITLGWKVSERSQGVVLLAGAAAFHSGADAFRIDDEWRAKNGKRRGSGD
jgi:hypothetical protein